MFMIHNLDKLEILPDLVTIGRRRKPLDSARGFSPLDACVCSVVESPPVNIVRFERPLFSLKTLLVGVVSVDTGS